MPKAFENWLKAIGDKTTVEMLEYFEGNPAEVFNGQPKVIKDVIKVLRESHPAASIKVRGSHSRL